jgi:hypothetical protein
MTTFFMLAILSSLEQIVGFLPPYKVDCYLHAPIDNMRCKASGRTVGVTVAR